MSRKKTCPSCGETHTEWALEVTKIDVFYPCFDENEELVRLESDYFDTEEVRETLCCEKCGEFFHLGDE